MPSEQSPPSNSSPVRQGSSEKGQHPRITGGVRGLLGLPNRESGVLSTIILTAPPRGHHYGQPPLLARGESDEGFREGALDKGLSEKGGSAGADSQNDLSCSFLQGGASLPKTKSENPADTRSTTTKMPVEQREHTNFLIPGVSAQRTEFAALSHTTDTEKVTQQAEALETSPDKVTPLHAPVLLPHTREDAMFDIEFLSRLEHLVGEDTRAQHSVEVQHRSVALRPPNPIEQMRVPNGERGGYDLVQRFEHLQRTVRDLAATVSSQAARNREVSQFQSRDQQRTPLQRMVIIKRSEASLTTPRAFWERSRLGRFHLRTGR